MKKWVAKRKNQGGALEGVHEWVDVRDSVVQLSLLSDDVSETLCIELPEGMEKYTQGKTASADLGSGEVTLESRYIGFVLGNNVIRIRLSENSNHISVEVGDKDGIL